MSNNEQPEQNSVVMKWWNGNADKILTTLLASFLIFSAAWAWNMDRQMTTMNVTLASVSTQLQQITRDAESRESAAIRLEQRLQKVEDTRVKEDEMRDLQTKYESLKERVIRLEIQNERP